MDRYRRTAAILVLALLLSAAMLMAGCTQQQPLTVKITDHPIYGQILTDSTGRSLYFQARDVPNTGAVANLGEVGRFYPPFYAETVDGGNGINISEFGYLSRADGQRQTTFRGWPLYYYINDRNPGDAKSQGANNITFLVKPDYTVMVRENTSLGVFLTDTAGATLLARENETGAEPLAGAVPFRAPSIVGPSPLVQAADFGTAAGPSGSQTTYRGQLLFAWSDPARPGTIPGDADGFETVVLAPALALAAVEDPVASPAVSPGTSASTGTTGPTTTITTVRATTTSTTASGYNSYTGGDHTPTPHQTVTVIRPSTQSTTSITTWTPIVTTAPSLPPTTPAATTAGPATPFPTTTAAPTVTVPLTTPSTTATTIVSTTVTTTVPTTASTTQAPTASPTTILPSTPPTTIPTTTPTTLPTVPLPPTTPPTVVTTLPLPFPTGYLPNPAVVPPGENSG